MTVMDGVTTDMHRSSQQLTDLDATLQSLRASLQPEIDAARATWYSAGSGAAFDKLVVEYDNDLLQIRNEMMRQAAAHEFSNREYTAAEDASHAALSSVGGSGAGGTGMGQALNPAGS